MNMNEVPPCKDCITLAICKSRVKSYTYLNSLSYLRLKCSLLDKYLTVQSHQWRVLQEKHNKVYKILGRNN